MRIRRLRQGTKYGSCKANFGRSFIAQANCFAPKHIRFTSENRARGIAPDHSVGKDSSQLPERKGGLCVSTVSIVCGPTGHLQGWACTRSAALPGQELRSLMNSRTQAAIGSASIMPSIAVLRLAV